MTAIFKKLDWLSKEKDIIEYVNQITAENDSLKEKIKLLENPKVLTLLPTSLRGKRFYDIIVPSWFQLEDEAKFMTDLKHYLQNEVYPTRVIR